MRAHKQVYLPCMMWSQANPEDWARRAFDLSNETALAKLEIQTIFCPDVEVRADTGSAKATTALGNSVLNVF